MKSKITHNGIVESAEECLVRVRIAQTSACASCQVAGHCSVSESKNKTIEVATPYASSFSEGDRVAVSVSVCSVRRALLVGFGLPFVIMVLSVFVCMWLTSDETFSAAAGLASLVPYYILVWSFRVRIGSGVIFGIDKL